MSLPTTNEKFMIRPSSIIKAKATLSSLKVSGKLSLIVFSSSFYDCIEALNRTESLNCCMIVAYREWISMRAKLCKEWKTYKVCAILLNLIALNVRCWVFFILSIEESRIILSDQISHSFFANYLLFLLLSKTNSKHFTLHHITLLLISIFSLLCPYKHKY